MIYLDTGCLLKLYYPEPESPRVLALISGQVLAFIALHELELSNALELKVFRKEARPAQAKPPARSSSKTRAPASSTARA